MFDQKIHQAKLRFRRSKSRKMYHLKDKLNAVRRNPYSIVISSGTHVNFILRRGASVNADTHSTVISCCSWALDSITFSVGFEITLSCSSGPSGKSTSAEKLIIGEPDLFP